MHILILILSNLPDKIPARGGAAVGVVALRVPVFKPLGGHVADVLDDPGAPFGVLLALLQGPCMLRHRGHLVEGGGHHVVIGRP